MWIYNKEKKEYFNVILYGEFKMTVESSIISYYLNKIGDGLSYALLVFDASDNMIEIRFYDGVNKKHKKLPFTISNGSYGIENYTIKIGPDDVWSA
jgi:hypothetical protein